MVDKVDQEKIGQEQFHSFVFGNSLSWQEIIYDLINSEQLDPWNIDLVVLAQKYITKIKELEEANFILSSKVLMVCSILLRIKSEILLSHHLKDLDDILFNKKKEKEEISIKELELDDDEVPALFPRTPLPRYKKISLSELMATLNKAIETEARRDVRKTAEKEMYDRTQLYMPKKGPNLAQKIKEVYDRVKVIFGKQEKVSFTEFAGSTREERINHFVPLLHLDTQSKVWLEQEKYLEEIWILKERLKKIEEEMEEDGIITNRIESEFEKSLEEMEEEGWEVPERDEGENIDAETGESERK